MKIKFTKFPLAVALAVIVVPMITGQSNAQTRFIGGFPASETAQRIHDEEDYERAIQAYESFYPTISQEGILQGARDAGMADNKGALIFSCGPKNVLFTANSDTPYLFGAFNL